MSIALEKAIPPVLISQGPSSCERWYVVHTLPQQEVQAEYQLRRQGFRPFLETLIENTNAGGIFQFGQQLRVGQAVQILSGPFANAIGELQRLDANGRVKVLLNIMNGRISATLSRSLLKPV